MQVSLVQTVTKRVVCNLHYVMHKPRQFLKQLGLRSLAFPKTRNAFANSCLSAV